MEAPFLPSLDIYCIRYLRLQHPLQHLNGPRPQSKMVPLAQVVQSHGFSANKWGGSGTILCGSGSLLSWCGSEFYLVSKTFFKSFKCKHLKEPFDKKMVHFYHNTGNTDIVFRNSLTTGTQAWVFDEIQLGRTSRHTVSFC